MSLPRGWQTMTLDALYAALNDLRRRPTPQSTVDAIICSVQARGIAALREPANIERLSRCDDAARWQVNERIGKLKAGHAA